MHLISVPINYHSALPEEVRMDGQYQKQRQSPRDSLHGILYSPESTSVSCHIQHLASAALHVQATL
jgi:hypothetical protein